MDHSYEEIRNCILEILAKGITETHAPCQYRNLQITIAEEFERLERTDRLPNGDARFSHHDRNLFLEVFWDLFRQGIITLGLDDHNPNFPFFRVSSAGEKILAGHQPYFFHDLSSYEQVILTRIPEIDPITLVYLKEAMQAFLGGCLLSSSVMLGVATEHSFLKLLETIDANPSHSKTYESAFKQRNILQKFNKFKNLIEQNIATLPAIIKEDLDTNLGGILSMIRTFRNESGHPSGKIITREQTYVLLQLFIPCCKKIYDLINHFEKKQKIIDKISDSE